jgi:hypothetical protein
MGSITVTNEYGFQPKKVRLWGHDPLFRGIASNGSVFKVLAPQ